ncbi:MAG: ABC transporter ATP-binding protein [Candidatus Hodarchaeales archaeon]
MQLSSSHPIIELKAISKHFKIGKERIILFKELDFKCHEKEFIVFTGPSGCGKTTILQIIAGLTRVDQGNVRVFDHSLDEFNEESLALFRSSTIGLVFQMGHLIETLTVLENILLPVELAQRDEKDYEKYAWELLQEFQLSDRAHSLPIMLSGGEYQRVAFIRALILDPQILLVDEPTANQDERTKEIIFQKLAQIKGEKTVLVVTHSRDIFPYADRVLTPYKMKLREKNGIS